MRLISGTLYLYLQSVQSYISPPIAAAFLLGVFSRRITATAAVSGMIGGFLLGMLRLLAELNKASLGGALLAFASINFLHFAALLFLLCVAWMVVVSRFTRAPSDAQIEGLTYQTTTAEQQRSSRATWTRLDLVLSIVLVGLVALVMLVFRG